MFLKNFLKGGSFLIPLYLLALVVTYFALMSIDTLSDFPFMAWGDSFITLAFLFTYAWWSTKEEIKNKAWWDNYNAEKQDVIDAYTKRYGI